MAIKEKDLQTIESLSEGDKVRVVTSEGNSRNIDASVYNINIVDVVYDDNIGKMRTNNTWREIYNMLCSNNPPIFLLNPRTYDLNAISQYYFVAINTNGEQYTLTLRYFDVAPTSGIQIVGEAQTADDFVSWEE